MKIGFAWLLPALLLGGCFSPHYRMSTPEAWYQVATDSDPAPRVRLVNTFSVQAPEGQWSVHGPYDWGGVIFRGGPDNQPGRYVGYEVRFLLETDQFRRKEQQLRALKTGNFQAYVDESLEELRKFYAGLDLNGNDAGHPIPRTYSMKLATYRGMTCTLYEDEQHIFIASQRPHAAPGEQGPGDGAEQYGMGFFCPGFFNGVQAYFGYGVRIVVDNQHVVDGVQIDPAVLKADVLRRLQRALDSVRFNGEFTQRVPSGF